MTTTRRTLACSLLVALALLGSTACTKQSCRNAVCTVSMSGESVTDVDDSITSKYRKRKSYKSRLALERIEPTAVTISVDGARARLTLGQQATLEELSVKVLSISGKDVKLETRPA